MRRVLPAIVLFLLAPFVAEYLLGDLPLTRLGDLLVLAPLYGGGALLIREVVRRARRGWASILALALAFGIVAEAFVTQSLFNPNPLGMNLRLLEPAYVPALGIGAWWTVLVLTMHAVWSISVPIALAEGLSPGRAGEPWLGDVGLAISAAMFVSAAVFSAFETVQADPGHFVASGPQLAWSGVAWVGVIVAAFLLPRPAPPRDSRSGWVPSPWLVGLGALIAGSLVLLVPGAWGRRAVVLYLALDALVIVALGLCSRRRGWDARHRLALAGGAALAYAAHAFAQPLPFGQNAAAVRISNVVFALGLAVLLAVATRRTAATIPRRRSGVVSGPGLG
jgi:hypothetical protein